MKAPVAVLVFARAPVAGQVKTRLIPGLSAGQAAKLYGRMLRRAVATAVESGVGPVELHCAPDTTCPALRALARRYDLVLREQQGPDLGARMGGALARAVARHAGALLMGSDAPALDVHRLRSCAQALRDGFPACFVPAADGGYVLVGVSAPPPAALFDGVPWGSAEVMGISRNRLRSLGWSWWETAPVRDVDRVQDLDLVPADLPWP